MEKRGVSQHLADEVKKEASVKRTGIMDDLTARAKNRMNKNFKRTKERPSYGK